MRDFITLPPFSLLFLILTDQELTEPPSGSIRVTRDRIALADPAIRGQVIALSPMHQRHV